MNALTVKHGHSQLRINFEPYLTLSAQQGARLSDIAEQLGISRQAANQFANQIEQAGYIQRVADPSDGRAKLIVTTPRAKAMMAQGAREALRVQRQLEDLVGKQVLAEVTASLSGLSRELGILLPHEEAANGGQLPLAVLLPRLSEYISNRLQQLTMDKGHPHLKRSFGQVLTSIGPGGGRIQQMAVTHDVSKQAISAIATELEDIGYVVRKPDPADARQVVLKFTERGKALLVDSVGSLDQLAAEFVDLLGESQFRQIRQAMAQIYRSLNLEQDIFGYASTGDMRALARQLYRELGEEGAKTLGHMLITGESPE